MITDFYDQTFTIEDNSSTLSAMGSWEPTSTTVSTFLGFIDMLTQSNQKTGQQYLDDATHIVGCGSTNTWISTSRRLKDSSGYIYQILHIDNPVKRNHHIEMYVSYQGSDQLST